MKLFEKLGNYFLNLSVSKQKTEVVKKLAKEPYVNAFFKMAMEKGELELEPYFTLADGRDVYISKLGSISYENYIMATNEIPQQYEEFGQRKDKLVLMHSEAVKQIRMAQIELASEPFEAHEKLSNATNLLLSMGADIAFGSPVRRHIEQLMCFLHTKDMNPYTYDYSGKQELMNAILNEWNRLSFFLDSIQFLKLLGLETALNIDSDSSLMEMMERPEIKLQIAMLQRLGLEASSDEKMLSKEIINEYMNLTALHKIAYQ